MNIGRIILKAIIMFAIFVAIWLLINVITGNGFTGEDVSTAVISGVIFALLYGFFTYFAQKRKLGK